MARVPNDILITVKGSGVGKTNMMGSQELAISRQLMAIRATKVSTDYLYLFVSQQFEYFQNLANGAAIPGISRTDVLSLKLAIPDFGEQGQVVERLLKTSTQTQALEALYQRKIDALTELKQSLLQQAFAGELTRELTATDAIQAVEVTDTRSPEFAANVIAVAFRKHENDGMGKAFGRVKEQKFLHLVESVGGLNLGRTPMKDAAGPNDFPHMLKAEKWAKENQFFELVQDKNSKKYDFKKLANFDEMSAKAFAALKPYKAQMDKVADILVPMGWREAEVFATVHAAWNNLIINGNQITNDAIVFEARENWHAKKLEIPKQEFYDAIKLIRSKNLNPDGTAKRVGGQERLI